MRTTIVASTVMLVSIGAFAQHNYDPIQKVVAADRAVHDWFGCDVSISGDYAIVGAPSEDDASGGDVLYGAGAAYIYKRTDSHWRQIKKLVADVRANAASFGTSVSISGDYAVIGAHEETRDAGGGNPLGSAGAAYVFDRNDGGTDNWGLVKKLVASDRQQLDNFGQDVAISGDYVVVGSMWQDYDAAGTNEMADAGAAYVFSRNHGGTNNWGEVRKIVALDRVANDQFGASVSISGTYVLVGAPRQDFDQSGANPIDGAGAAYVFARDHGGADNWGQVRKIVPTDRASYIGVGGTTAISGDNAMASTNSGVLVFSRNHGGTNNWGQVKRLIASDSEDGDRFGSAISMSGSYAIIGAIWHDHDATGGNELTNAGAAYIYSKDLGGADNWGQLKKIVSYDRANQDQFGRSAAISGSYAVVGAFAEDHDANGANGLTDAGSAYLFGEVTTPTIQSKDIWIQLALTNTIRIQWTKGNGARRVVFFKRTGNEQTAPIDGTTYSASTDFGSGTEIPTGWYCVYNDTGNRVTVNGLQPGALYRMIIFEYNGISGAENYLTTVGMNSRGAFTMPEEPAQATNISFSNVDTTSMTVSWTRGDGERLVVFMAATSSGSATPYDKMEYNPNPAFGSGMQIGSSGWYCVYRGTGASVDVTNLTPGTTYRVTESEYNGTSLLANYNLDSAPSTPYGRCGDDTRDNPGPCLSLHM